MTITTYTDREIALRQQLAAMTADRDEYQQTADKMAWDHKVERDTLRQQLAEAQALIDASRQQEAIGEVSGNDWSCALLYQDMEPGAAVYAAPVVADDAPYVNCDTCVHHYKDADQKPCNTCIHSGDFVNNFEPRITGVAND